MRPIVWWPRSNQVLMFADAIALHTCVRTTYGSKWRALDPTPLDTKTPTALGSAIEARLREVKPGTLELALSWDWAPGFVLDFGPAPMPRAARDALARLRMQETFGLDAVNWTVIQDAQRSAGSRSVFAASPAVIDAARSAARACNARIWRIEPAFAWSWRVFDQQRVQSCWWIVDHGQAITAVQVRNAVPHSIDHLHVGDLRTTSALELAIERLAIRRAVIDGNTLPMHWIHCDHVSHNDIPARAIVRRLHSHSHLNERAT